MSFHVTTAAGGGPEASLIGRAGKTPVASDAMVLVLPDTTAHGSQIAVLSACWAPPADLRAEQGKLAAVALCCRPERAPLFSVVRDEVFTLGDAPEALQKLQLVTPG